VMVNAPEGSPRQKFVHLALADTDRRVNEGKAVAPSFMLACMLWHDVQTAWTRLREQGEHPSPALQQAIDSVFDARIGDISGRGKLATDMREIWMMQPRFERRSGNQAYSLIEQARFRAGFDFLRLRADAGEASAELAEWWEDFSLGDDAEREALVQAVKEAPRPSSRGRRSPAPGRSEGAASGAKQADAEAPEEEADGSEGDVGAAAPRKRRRRRRKPSGAGGSGGAAPGGAGASGE
jgi:poly(A) polymerase